MSWQLGTHQATKPLQQLEETIKKIIAYNGIKIWNSIPLVTKGNKKQNSDLQSSPQMVPRMILEK